MPTVLMLHQYSANSIHPSVHQQAKTEAQIFRADRATCILPLLHMMMPSPPITTIGMQDIYTLSG